MAAGFSLYSTDSDDIVSLTLTDTVTNHQQHSVLFTCTWIIVSTHHYLTAWTLDLVDTPWAGQVHVSNADSTEL